MSLVWCGRSPKPCVSYLSIIMYVYVCALYVHVYMCVFVHMYAYGYANIVYRQRYPLLMGMNIWACVITCSHGLITRNHLDRTVISVYMFTIITHRDILTYI